MLAEVCGYLYAGPTALEEASTVAVPMGNPNQECRHFLSGTTLVESCSSPHRDPKQVKRPNPLPWGWSHVGYNRGRSTHLPCRPYFVLGEGQNDGLANGKHRQMTVTLVEAKGNRNAAVEIAELMRKASTRSYTNPAICTNKKTQSHYWSIAQCTDVCVSAQLCASARLCTTVHSASPIKADTPRSRDTHWLPHLLSVYLPVGHVI